MLTVPITLVSVPIDLFHHTCPPLLIHIDPIFKIKGNVFYVLTIFSRIFARVYFNYYKQSWIFFVALDSLIIQGISLSLNLLQNSVKLVRYSEVVT